MPKINPAAAGMNASRPMPSLMSMAGIKRDHTEAAIITPEAKPRRAFCTTGRIPWRRKYTQAAPAVVPKNGINIPINIFI